MVVYQIYGSVLQGITYFIFARLIWGNENTGTLTPLEEGMTWHDHLVAKVRNPTFDPG